MKRFRAEWVMPANLVRPTAPIEGSRREGRMHGADSGPKLRDTRGRSSSVHATFSIVGVDRRTGQLGAALASKLPCVGSFCPVVREGLAAVVTQAWTNPYLPARLLERLETGEPPEAALKAVMAAEVEAELRQIAVIDIGGRAAAFSGAEVEPVFGQRCGDGCVVLGNMLPDLGVLDAMTNAFEDQADSLAVRLLAALTAGAEAGGDVRGVRSAALLVMGEEAYPLVDLRADDHAEPVRELRRLHDAALRDLVPFIAALPTRANPKGRFETVRAALRPKRRLEQP